MSPHHHDRTPKGRIASLLFVVSAMAAQMLLGLSVAGCSTPRSPPTTGPSTTSTPRPAVAADAGDSERLEIEALLLLIGDRRVFEPLVVSRALESPHPHLRRRLALVLAQIGDARGLGALSVLLTDKEAAVRRTAAFAFGHFSSPDDSVDERLLRATVDDDRETGLRAVEALARRGARLETIASGLVSLPPREILERLMLPLFRFRGAAVTHWAELGLGANDPALRSWAAYGLAREPQTAGTELLRGLLADADPWISGWAARALGRIGDRTDIDRLTPLLGRPEAGPVVQALRSARELVTRGAAAPPDSWRESLLRLFDDPRLAVRITALEIAGIFLRDEPLGSALAARAASGADERERILALGSLAVGADPRAEGLVLRAAMGASAAVRQGAAEAAGAIGAESVLRSLADDSDAGVRAAALAVGLAALGSETAATSTALPIVETALADTDPAPRAVALEWAVEHPVVPHRKLLRAIAGGDRIPDARLAGARALAARAKAMPSERDEILGSLEMLAHASVFVVRRAVADALVDLGREAPALGPATRKQVAFYREVLAQTRDPYVLTMETDRGAVELRLDCSEAPIGCLSFLQLARQGFYEGLAFHRVVPDFVVQAGDPRGDGRGGPGFRVRGEPTMKRYAQGVLGMARGAPDTAGSQFFITLSAQPHLDGSYTAFGEVTDGSDVLGRIVQGDRIVRFVATP